MIRINVSKEELESFFDTFWNWKWWYKKEYIIKLLSFQEFKEIFCSKNFSFLECINKESYEKVYDNISSNQKTETYVKIRKFIIEKFTEKIKFCPYCWKNPLIHFDENNKKKRMFQFDHFFPKKKYHKWIINFYNLIPSCNACNHLKLEDYPLEVILNWWVIFHPYFWNLYLDNAKILQKDYWKNADIRLNYISQNSKFFKLWKKYLHSQDTFNTFDFIRDKRAKIKNEQNNFLKKWKKLSEIEKEKFKNYFFKSYTPENEDDILKYSNGKLKKDLIDNLEIDIKYKPSA